MFSLHLCTLLFCKLHINPLLFKVFKDKGNGFNDLIILTVTELLLCIKLVLSFLIHCIIESA